MREEEGAEEEEPSRVEEDILRAWNEREAMELFFLLPKNSQLSYFYEDRSDATRRPLFCPLAPSRRGNWNPKQGPQMAVSCPGRAAP